MFLLTALLLLLTGSVESPLPTHPHLNAIEHTGECPLPDLVCIFVISPDISSGRHPVLIIRSKANYDPYGKVKILAPDGVTVRTASAVRNPWMFTGRRLDGERMVSKPVQSTYDGENWNGMLFWPYQRDVEMA